MSSYVASLAKRVGDVAEFVHRSAQPLDDDGATPVPAFLKQKVEEVHGQVVRGRPFSLGDLVRALCLEARRRSGLLTVRAMTRSRHTSMRWSI